MTLSKACKITLLLVAGFMAAAPAASAATRYVSNTGADSGTCGAKESPCRSITQAITNAGAGDSISVGPGLYGDINDDGSLGGTGEEPNVASCAGLDSCMLQVSKAVKISSTNGAGATVVRSPLSAVENVVSIESADAVFGKANKGFTVSGGSQAQIVIRTNTATVAGNRVMAEVAFAYGIWGQGDNLVIRSNVGRSSALDGFCISFRGDAIEVIGNLCQGFYAGFDAAATNWTMTGNVATDNHAGMQILIDTFSNALAPSVFDKNSFVANGEFGVFMWNRFPPGGGSTVTITRSNFFANGGSAASSFPNCGIVARNTGGSTLVVNADEVFWGAASGPGPNPSDSFGGPCSFGTDPVTPNATAPVAKAHSIKVPPQR